MATMTQITDFIKTAKADKDFSQTYARLRCSHDLIRYEGVTQIRSKKHTMDALAFDVLGNMSALHSDGSIRQYITKKEIRGAGISGI
jgi:hypothetical protein